MRSILIFLPLVLGACQTLATATGGDVPQSDVIVPPGEVRVVSAAATPGEVTIRLSDGARCTGTRPEGTPGGWSGVTADCGYALPYTVMFKQGSVPQRFQIEVPAAGTGPRAEILVVDVDGVRRLFAAPLGSNVRFETQG
ncbi:MAG: hypothetical protein WBA02_07990 [Jannaschia helgolandensis]|jgi:hypothetical protein|uniref:Uncharacterized protein n=1 Tax=Jannaschia helgolandensis TaxID=188906 RepID=A0A1H7L781_9RHOB|nr:hypothetical protein [Jannaschia helgolandensis]SEK94798.1 hypothetical protein SAMN04488526_1629 [Jannaschia helgolandensis]|tara:strand:- start:2 stop:421 length:420 start_codon:yes stop_codon:yes gene_type:complete